MRIGATASKRRYNRERPQEAAASKAVALNDASVSGKVRVPLSKAAGVGVSLGGEKGGLSGSGAAVHCCSATEHPSL